MTSYANAAAYAGSPPRIERCPVSELDPFSDEALTNPWRVYAELQRLGSAVWLNKYEMFALTRYDSVLLGSQGCKCVHVVLWRHDE